MSDMQAWREVRMALSWFRPRIGGTHIYDAATTRATDAELDGEYQRFLAAHRAAVEHRELHGSKLSVDGRTMTPEERDFHYGQVELARQHERWLSEGLNLIVMEQARRAALRDVAERDARKRERIAELEAAAAAREAATP